MNCVWCGDKIEDGAGAWEVTCTAPDFPNPPGTEDPPATQTFCTVICATKGLLWAMAMTSNLPLEGMALRSLEGYDEYADNLVMAGRRAARRGHVPEAMR